MRMNCSEAQAELPLFVGGDLESSCHERVAVHLETCEPCRSALASTSEAREVLRAGLNRTADLHGAFVASSPRPSVWSSLREQLHADGLIRTETTAQTSTSDDLVTATAAPRVTPAPTGKLLFWSSRFAAAAGLLMMGAVAGQMWNANTGTSTPTGLGLDLPGASSPLVQVQPAGLSASPALLAEVTTPTPSVLTPVENPGFGSLQPGFGSLQEVLRKEDTFLYSEQNNRYFHGRGYAPGSAFPSRSGISLVSGVGGGALPAATVRNDGVR